MKGFRPRRTGWLVIAVTLAVLTVAAGPAAAATPNLSLAFNRGPEGTAQGQPITGEPYFPAGAGVEVWVLNSTGKIANVDDQIRLTALPSGETIATATASSGKAVFGPLPHTLATGLHQLRAEAFTRRGDPDTRVLGATSQHFRIVQSASSCFATTLLCATSSAGARGTKLDITGPTSNGARVWLASTMGDAALQVDCTAPAYGGYFPLTPPEATALVDGTTVAKTLTLTVPKFFMQNSWLTGLPLSNNGASFMEICFGAPATFPVASGGDGSGLAAAQGTFDWNEDGVAGESETIYAGTLPDCPSTGPCIDSRKKSGAGDGIITALIPSGFAADPKIRG
jgi:hypothetical protein